MNDIINQELSEIKSIKDNLFLNCSKCKQTCYLTFNRRYPYNININCYNCQNNSEICLNDYIQNLSKCISPIEIKCNIHNNFLDKFCYKCHKQFCSQCDMNSHNTCYPIKPIFKIITKERLEEVQKIIKICKEDFEKYINIFMNQYLIKLSNDSHEFIIEGLILPYIQHIKSFFIFCDCAILNYNIDYPDFYQQMNLKVILSIFKKKIDLMSLNEAYTEFIFSYEDNNYFSKHRVNLSLSKTIDNNKSIILNTFFFNDEIMVINHYDGIRINKNGECISTLSPHQKKVDFYKINENAFTIFRKNGEVSIMEIFSIKYNEIIYSKYFNNFHCFFNLEDNNKFGIASSGLVEIYKLEEKNVQRESEKSIKKRSKDMIYIPKTKYIASLGMYDIDLYNKDDFALVKSINLNEKDIFNKFYKLNDGRILLGGYKIGYFDINNWNIITIRDDNIKAFTSGSQTEIDYSDIVMTYFNRLICKKYFYRITGSTYEDAPNTVDSNETTVCVLDYDPEKNTTTLIENRKEKKPENICLNMENEILITSFGGVQIYCID